VTEPFVVVGGDAAGLSAASKLARENPDRDVVVFEKGRWVSYAHCGEPYFVKGEVETLDDLLSLSPEEIGDRGIDLRRDHEVVGIDTDAETVTVEGPDGAIEQRYGDLLVATGARARTSGVSGSSLDCAFTMHGLDDAARVRALLTPPADFDLASLGGEGRVDAASVERYGAMTPPDRVALVGGGYVGIEMAEAFDAYDVDVHLFQRSDRLVPPFGDAVGARVADHLRERGVHLHLDEEVRRLDGTDRVERVVCSSGTEQPVDAALVGVGVAPNTALVEDTPVGLGDSGAIAVDAYGRTSVEGVYAAGDCAEDAHAVTGRPAWIPLGLTANRAGRAVGATAAGDPTPTGEVAGTAMMKAFELECGRTGLVGDDEARQAGFEPVSETVTTRSRSGYYPGSAETTVTLTADRGTGRLLGGSIVGPDRAAVRIDTVATALTGELTVHELERTDLGYAPPFSPVWDPVLVAAKVLGGRL
jgi:3-phenylpropionate/trans-cinnamate dioxygenase ferredoxin reductase subunit